MFMIVGNNFKTAMSVTLWPQNPQKNLFKMIKKYQISSKLQLKITHLVHSIRNVTLKSLREINLYHDWLFLSRFSCITAIKTQILAPEKC